MTTGNRSRIEKPFNSHLVCPNTLQSVPAASSFECQLGEFSPFGVRVRKPALPDWRFLSNKWPNIEFFD